MFVANFVNVAIGLNETSHKDFLVSNRHKYAGQLNVLAR